MIKLIMELISLKGKIEMTHCNLNCSSSIKNTITKHYNMKIKKHMFKAGKALLLVLIFLLFASAGFRDSRSSGWYQQWLPDLNGSTIKDITFLDSLTGFAVTNTNSLVEGYILKTTNAGDNWNVVYTYHPPSTNTSFTRLQFADSNTGYASTLYFDFIKTTDGGTTWINYPNFPWGIEDMAVINKDTVLAATTIGFTGGVYRTTDGGNNWQLIWTNGTSGNPNRIYMFDKNLGFHCDDNTNSYTRRTSNGGLNWTNINENPFFGIAFFDSLIGWKGSLNGIKKTTNGGLNWFIQATPPMSFFQCFDISIVNKDTVWFVGCRKTGLRAVICKTTNGGTNWGYQMLDTSINFYNFYHLCFTNKNNGWAYFVNNTGVHTNTGGNDTTYYTAVNNQTLVVPGDYVLEQNYPNPFNQLTIIKYQLSKRANVRINVYDINGREVDVLISKIQSPGVYYVRYDAGNLASGVYFYNIVIYGEITKQTFTETRKMLLLK